MSEEKNPPRAQIFRYFRIESRNNKYMFVLNSANVLDFANCFMDFANSFEAILSNMCFSFLFVESKTAQKKSETDVF